MGTIQDVAWAFEMTQARRDALPAWLGRYLSAVERSHEEWRERAMILGDKSSALPSDVLCFDGVGASEQLIRLPEEAEISFLAEAQDTDAELGDLRRSAQFRVSLHSGDGLPWEGDRCLSIEANGFSSHRLAASGSGGVNRIFVGVLERDRWRGARR